MDAHTQKKSDDFKAIFAKFHGPIEQCEKDGHILRKSKSLSIAARESGNELYVKKGHNSQIHKDILNYYSKSIVFAPEGTEELALGYSNRSILLMHIHHDEQSLVDIDRALKITKNDVFKRTLQARKEKYLELISKKSLQDSAENVNFCNKEDQENFASKLMNFKRSATLPSASDCVGLANNDTFGRHLIATRDIEPGEILIVEEAYVCSPQKGLIYIVCSHCLQIAWNGIPCNDCVFAIYCSETCKNEALQEYHDIECSMLKYMDYIADRMCDRMAAARLLIKAVKKESFEYIINEAKKKTEEEGGPPLLSDGILSNDHFKCYYNLLSHAKDAESKNEDDDLCALEIVYLLAEHTGFFTIGQNHTCHVSTESHLLLSIKDILIKLKHILDTNAFWYQAQVDCDCQTVDECKDTCNSSRGVFLTLTCSLLNHSCTPNVSRIYVPKRKVIVFATSPIKKGEQLYDSYGVTYIQDVELRQTILEHGFHFLCKCLACKDNFKMTRLPEAPKKVWKKIMTEYKQCFPETIDDTFFLDNPIKLEISEESFQHIKKMSELFYKHMDLYAAFGYNVKCRDYIEILLLSLYGEKYVMPNDC